MIADTGLRIGEVNGTAEAILALASALQSVAVPAVDWH